MQRQIVLQLQSLQFRGSGGTGGGPIRLRDPHSNEWIDHLPEWVKGVRNEPAAYVRGQRPLVEIGLQAGWFAPCEFDLSAWGPPLTASGGAPSTCVPLVGPYRVKLTEHDRRLRFISAGILPFNAALPDQIGRHQVPLEWYADWSEGGHSRRLFLGHTDLVLCTTWKPMVNAPPRGLESWAYAQVMEWSCAWSRGATAPKQICDLLLENLPATGLQYGVPGWDVRSMLLNGGGMCGGWYQLFAQLANCQGVALSLETLMLPAGSEAPWEGLVLSAPGLNQVAPSFGVGMEGHYRDTREFPPPPPDTLRPETTRRYFFEQDPDGHCINMLDGEDGMLTIYDPSFQLTATQVEMRLPPREGRVDCFPRASDFRTRYFDAAVQFLMSQRGKPPPDADPLAFGVTVESPVIPVVTLVWNRDPAPSTTRQHLLDKLRRVVATHVAEPAATAWRARIRKLESAPSSAGPVLAALEETTAIPLRPGAPVPHAMHPAELIQHTLLELMQVEGPAQGARAALEQLHGEAVSPRLRAMALRLL